MHLEHVQIVKDGTLTLAFILMRSMNNFTFGDETMGYYETIAGGAGAGPTW